MNLPITVTQDDLLEILLNVAPSRPVFIWGAPGIGKSALVEQFASEIGLPCVSLLGSQLAPEDIIGIPQRVHRIMKKLGIHSVIRRKQKKYTSSTPEAGTMSAWMPGSSLSIW